MLLFKLVDAQEWAEARVAGVFRGSAVDRKDGYIHLSTAGQVEETAARHFFGHANLLLIAVDSERLPREALRWEPSRGGALFPHLYASLSTADVAWEKALPWRDGRHVFPPLLE